MHGINVESQTFSAQLQLNTYFLLPLHTLHEWNKSKVSKRWDNLCWEDTTGGNPALDGLHMEIKNIIGLDPKQYQRTWVRLEGAGLDRPIENAYFKALAAERPGSPQGVVVVKHKISGTFCQKLNVSAFPFDSHILHVDVQFQTDTVVLASPEELALAFGGGSKCRVDKLRFDYAGHSEEGQDTAITEGSTCSLEWRLNYHHYMLPPIICKSAHRDNCVYRRGSFRVSRYPIDVSINIFVPMVLLGFLTLVTALGLPDSWESALFPGSFAQNLNGDLGTAASIFLAFVSTRAYSSNYLPTVQHVTYLEMWALIVSFVNAVALGLCFYGSGENRKQLEGIITREVHGTLSKVLYCVFFLSTLGFVSLWLPLFRLPKTSADALQCVHDKGQGCEAKEKSA